MTLPAIITRKAAVALPPKVNGALIVAGQPLSDELMLDVIGLQVAFATRAMDEDERVLRAQYVTEALAGFEQFLAAFVLKRIRVRNPAGRFAPDGTLIFDIETATRNALKHAVIRTCLGGEAWRVFPTGDLPAHWFDERAAIEPFQPGCLIPDDAVCRWVREHIERTEKVDTIRQVAAWTLRDYSAGYSYAPDCLRRGYSPAAVKRLPDAALPDGFRAAYEAAVARLALLRKEEDEEREKEAAASRERRGTWINNPDREQPHQ